MLFKTLLLGDIVGRPGRDVVERQLPALMQREGIHFVVANGENSAGGSGITPEAAQKLFACGLDVITTGDHIWKKKEVIQLLEKEPRVLRPANYSPMALGKGWIVVESHNGIPVGVINLLGRVFMQPIDCPFRAVDEVLKEISKKVKIVIVDMHAEATSEKIAMGWYLDGRVSAVVGTHTHVQTADERILPNGTAYITDLGMTGPYKSVLGRDIDRVLKAIITQMPTRFDVAEKDVRISGVIITLDSSTGKALEIKRLVVHEGN
jgi:metallophosphoesterase (TIGR00282 family)